MEMDKDKDKDKKSTARLENLYPPDLFLMFPQS